MARAGIGLAAGLAVAAAGAALLTTRPWPAGTRPASEEIVRGTPAPAAPAEDRPRAWEVPAPAARAEAPPTPPARVRAGDPERGADGDVLRIAPDQVLATVDGQPVRLEHLGAVPPNAAAVHMDRETYAFRLRRAIEVELTFQAARRTGVELAPAQQQRLRQVEAIHEASFPEEARARGAVSSRTPGQQRFEERLTAALLLQHTLVAAESGIGPEDPTYADARRALLDRLRAEADIRSAAAN